MKFKESLDITRTTTKIRSKRESEYENESELKMDAFGQKQNMYKCNDGNRKSPRHMEMSNNNNNKKNNNSNSNSSNGELKVSSFSTTAM